MKRVWLGVGILSVLLAAGLGMTVVMEGIHNDISRELKEAAVCALEENWEQADRLAESAKGKWEGKRKFVAAFADHELLEEMDRLLAELTVYRTNRMPADYASVCLCIACQAEAIAESHSFRWWHLL